MNIPLILSRKFQGCFWSLDGDDYAGLHWKDDSPKPTEKELEALWPTVQYEVAYEQVEEARSQAYQKDSDPIFFQYQRGEATEAEWLAAVESVKDAHPYPETV
jgi:hypothetical protein